MKTSVGPRICPTTTVRGHCTFLYLPFSPFLHFPLRVCTVDDAHLLQFLPLSTYLWGAVIEGTSISTFQKKEGGMHPHTRLGESLIHNQGMYFQIQNMSFSRLKYNFSFLTVKRMSQYLPEKQNKQKQPRKKRPLSEAHHGREISPPLNWMKA